MTADQKQNEFKNIVRANAESFLQQCINGAEDFIYDPKNAGFFINKDKHKTSQTAVNFFRLMLSKRLQEMNETYLKA